MNTRSWTLLFSDANALEFGYYRSHGFDGARPNPPCVVMTSVCVCVRCRSYRDVAVDDEQLLSGHVELAAQLVRLPVQNPEALVIRVENGLQKLQLGLQSRNRHVPLLISGHQEPRNRERGGQKKKKRRAVAIPPPCFCGCQCRNEAV